MTPRRAVSPGVAPELPNLPAAEVPTPTEQRRERQLEDVLQAIGNDGRIAVYNDGRYAGVMPIEEFSLDALLDQYGGGDKTLIIYQGKTKVETVRVQLDADIPATSPRQRKAEDAKAKAAAPSGGVDLTTMMASMMAAQMQAMSATQQMMTGMVGAVTSLMTARPERDPMDVALQMARLMKEAQGGGVGTTEVLTLLEKGIGMGKLLQGGGDEDGTLGIVKEGLGIVGKIVDAQAGARTAEGLGAATQRDGARLLGVGGAGAASGRVGSIEDDQGGSGGVRAAHVSGGGGGSGSDGGGGVTGEATVRPWVSAIGPHFGVLASMSHWMSPETAAAAIDDRLTDIEFDDLMADIYDETAPGFGGRLAATFPAATEIDPGWLQSLVSILISPGDNEAGDGAGAAGAGDEGSGGTP